MQKDFALLNPKVAKFPQNGKERTGFGNNFTVSLNKKGEGSKWQTRCNKRPVSETHHQKHRPPIGAT